MEPLFEIGIAPGEKGTATKGLYRQLRTAITEGRLAPGTRLPPTRRAEAFFGVSRNTIAEAYARLISEGYVTSRHGAGTYVAERTPESAIPTEANTVDYALNAFWLRPDTRSAMAFWHDSDAPLVSLRADFRPALIDSRLFPHEAFRRLSARQLRGLERKPPGIRSPQGNPGHYHLREAIARHIAVTRAVACRGDDILVTAGAQQAFDLLARVLVTPGETVVAVEDPGYPPLRVAFAAAGARIVPVGVDEDGLMVDDLPSEVKVICVTPSHQFPLGMTMSPRRRQALAVFARTHGAVIIEDDYDGEFRHDGAPPEALHTKDTAERVFYVGSFSKCMLPTFRLGFVVAPAWARPALITAKNAADWHCPVPMQQGVAAFIDEGLLDRHIRRVRPLYRRRRDLVWETLSRDFADVLTPVVSHYGLHVTAVARPGIAVESAVARVAGEGVRLHSLARYYLGPATRAGLIFGLGAADEATIEYGLRCLRQAF